MNLQGLHSLKFLHQVVFALATCDLGFLLFFSAWQFQPGVKMEMWCDIFKDSQPQGSDQICKKLQTGKLHICVTYHPYSREKILAMRGGNETEKKIHEEHQNLQSKCHLKSEWETPTESMTKQVVPWNAWQQVVRWMCFSYQCKKKRAGEVLRKTFISIEKFLIFV